MVYELSGCDFKSCCNHYPWKFLAKQSFTPWKFQKIMSHPKEIPRRKAKNSWKCRFLFYHLFKFYFFFNYLINFNSTYPFFLILRNSIPSPTQPLVFFWNRPFLKVLQQDPNHSGALCFSGESCIHIFFGFAFFSQAAISFFLYPLRMYIRKPVAWTGLIVPA